MFSKWEKLERLARIRLGRGPLEPGWSLRWQRRLVDAESILDNQSPQKPDTDTQLGA